MEWVRSRYTRQLRQPVIDRNPSQIRLGLAQAAEMVASLARLIGDIVNEGSIKRGTRRMLQPIGKSAQHRQICRAIQI